MTERKLQEASFRKEFQGLTRQALAVSQDNEIVSVILGEWGEWGACSATCGTGKRSRETCKTEFKPGNTCPPRQVTTQIEGCTVSCILSSSNVQGKFKGWQQEVMLTLLGPLEEMPGHQLSISLA